MSSPRLLGQLALGVARLLGGEHALERQQREPALLGRLAQLLEREAVLLERAQQVEPRLPGRLVGQPVEQALGFEVDRHGHIVTVAPPKC